MAIAERWEISADEARKYAGKWVAIKDGTVRFAANDPADVVAWLRANKVDADLVIALPREDSPKVWAL